MSGIRKIVNRARSRKHFRSNSIFSLGGFSEEIANRRGEDRGTPVSSDYKERDNKFSGKIQCVTVDLK
jgi:hypothetical protein